MANSCESKGYEIGVYVLEIDSTDDYQKCFQPVKHKSGLTVFIEPNPVVLPYKEGRSKATDSAEHYYCNVRKYVANILEVDDADNYLINIKNGFKFENVPKCGLFFREKDSPLELLPSINCIAYVGILNAIASKNFTNLSYDFVNRYLTNYRKEYKTLFDLYQETKRNNKIDDLYAELKKMNEILKDRLAKLENLDEREEVDHTPVTEATVPDTTVKRVEQIERSDNSTSLRNE